MRWAESEVLRDNPRSSARKEGERQENQSALTQESAQGRSGQGASHASATMKLKAEIATIEARPGGGRFLKAQLKEVWARCGCECAGLFRFRPVGRAERLKRIHELHIKPEARCQRRFAPAAPSWGPSLAKTCVLDGHALSSHVAGRSG